jgi:hypothetical protein
MYDNRVYRALADWLVIVPVINHYAQEYSMGYEIRHIFNSYAACCSVFDGECADRFR